MAQNSVKRIHIFHFLNVVHMKLIAGALIPLLTLSLACKTPKKAITKLGNNPIFFLDSVRITKRELKQLQPTDIARISIYNDSSAIRQIGPEGKDGVVYMETKVFDKKEYWTYFSSKSAAYASFVPTPESDTAVQYILNKRVLTTNFEGDLASINDKLFKTLTILDKETLQMKYGISGKTIGVWIKAKKPTDLYHAKKKF